VTGPHLLNEPVRIFDMLDQEEMIDNTCQIQRDLLNRLLYQYGETWISLELREILKHLDYAHERFSNLRATNVFPEQ